jgi:hypothetical protein
MFGNSLSAFSNHVSEISAPPIKRLTGVSAARGSMISYCIDMTRAKGSGAWRNGPPRRRRSVGAQAVAILVHSIDAKLPEK